MHYYPWLSWQNFRLGYAVMQICTYIYIYIFFIAVSRNTLVKINLYLTGTDSGNYTSNQNP